MCVNCGGSHEVISKSCPTWIKEKEILKVKYTHNITFPEARKIVNERQMPSSEQSSYASVIKSSSHTSVCVDHATQFEDIDGVQTSDRIIIPTKYKKVNTVVSSSESGQSPQTQTKSTEASQPQSSQLKTRAAGQAQPGSSKGGKAQGYGQGPDQAKSPPKPSSRQVAQPTSPVLINRFEVLVESDDDTPDDVEMKPKRSPEKPTY